MPSFDSSLFHGKSNASNATPWNCHTPSPVRASPPGFRYAAQYAFCVSGVYSGLPPCGKPVSFRISGFFTFAASLPASSRAHSAAAAGSSFGRSKTG